MNWSIFQDTFTTTTISIPTMVSTLVMVPNSSSRTTYSKMSPTVKPCLTSLTRQNQTKLTFPDSPVSQPSTPQTQDMPWPAEMTSVEATTQPPLAQRLLCLIPILLTLPPRLRPSCWPALVPPSDSEQWMYTLSLVYLFLNTTVLLMSAFHDPIPEKPRT